jgi:hypothetical protein
MSERNYYRATVLYKGEGKPYHNTYGGTMVVAGADEEDARNKAQVTFKGIMATQGHGSVDFIVEIYKVSLDEVKHILENKSKGLVN